MNFEFEQFVQYLKIEKNASAHTVEAYLGDLQQLQTFLLNLDFDNQYGLEPFDSEINIRELKKDHFLAWLENCYDRGIDKNSICRKIASLRSFYKFLLKKDFITEDPTLQLIFPRKRKSLPTFLTRKQMAELKEFEVKTFKDLRDKALLEIFYATGCRVSELTQVKLATLDLKNLKFKVLGKGNKERYVFLTENSAVWLKRYLKERRKRFGELNAQDNLLQNLKGEQLTTAGVAYIIEQRTKQAGLSLHVTPHTLRHSFATELMNNGADIRVVQELLGHKSLSTTQIYTHTTRKRLQEEYNKYHPHSGENYGNIKKS